MMATGEFLPLIDVPLPNGATRFSAAVTRYRKIGREVNFDVLIRFHYARGGD
jgi:hypothetical protein